MLQPRVARRLENVVETVGMYLATIESVTQLAGVLIRRSFFVPRATCWCLLTFSTESTPRECEFFYTGKSTGKQTWSRIIGEM